MYLSFSKPEKLAKERIRHRNVKSLHEHQRVAQRNETLCPMLSNFLRNRFWRKIGVSLRMRKFLLDGGGVDPSSSSTFTFAN